MNSPVITQWIDIAGPEGGFGGYLALPPAGRGPGLVLFQEIFGVNPHIRSVAVQYALDGFVVLAPDLFWRDAPRVELGYEGADRERAFALMKGLPPQAVKGDIEATLATLKARPEFAGKAGAIGYCLGGRLAYVMAAQGGIDAAVCYYGGGISGLAELAPAIPCPVQFHHAESDDNIPPSAIAQIEAAMAGKPAEFYLYPGAHHGFNCWARGAYHAPSAALAHGRSLQFLYRLF